MIIRGDRIVAAACVLPLTNRDLADSSLGTRHRAAVGITEQNDALAVVVSEETGIISVARGGRIARQVGYPATAHDFAGVPSSAALVRKWVIASMKRWLSNLGSALLALVLAVLVWVVAVREEYPRAQFGQPVSVSRSGLPENLSLFGDTLNEVRVEIRAPKARWPDLRARDFTAWVDLTGLKSGEYDVPVQVSPPDPQVQIMGVDPPVIRVRLEERKQKIVPVHVNIMDAPAFGYNWQTPVITPTLVTGFRFSLAG